MTFYAPFCLPFILGAALFLVFAAVFIILGVKDLIKLHRADLEAYKASQITSDTCDEGKDSSSSDDRS